MPSTTARLSSDSDTFFSVVSLTSQVAFQDPGSPLTDKAMTLSFMVKVYVPPNCKGWRSRIEVALPATQCSTTWVDASNNGPSVTNTLATRPSFKLPSSWSMPIHEAGAEVNAAKAADSGKPSSTARRTPESMPRGSLMPRPLKAMGTPAA